MQFSIPTIVAFILSCSAVSAKVITQCVSPGMFAMTFDDGPAAHTQELLQILRSKNAKITFHLTTTYLTDPNTQSMVKQIANDGHLIGLRTEASWNLLSMSSDQIKAGLARQGNVIANFSGHYPKFVVLPYGGYDQRVLDAVESTGLIVTSFNIDTYDYHNDGARTLNSVKLSLSLAGQGQGSFISVQHDGIKQSVAVTGQLVDIIRDNGYKLVKLDECLGMEDMTKNKVALKGADGVDMDVSGSPGSGGLLGGSPSDSSSNHSPNINGRLKVQKSAASESVSMSGLAIFAASVMAFLYLF